MERVEKRRPRGGGSRDSAGVTAVCPGTGMEQPAGQRDAGAEQGHEMFPPHPETGQSRNPTGNLAATEPLTWPWYRVLRPGVSPARCIPLATRARGHRRDPSVCQHLLLPRQESERHSPGKAEQTPRGHTCPGSSPRSASAHFLAEPCRWPLLLLLCWGSGSGRALG